MNPTHTWSRIAFAGLTAMTAQGLQAGGACSRQAQAVPPGDVPDESEVQDGMAWERLFAVTISNTSRSYWRLRPVGGKRSPMRDLLDPNRNMAGTLRLKPGEVMCLSFQYDRKATLFQAQFQVEDNQEQHEAVVAFLVDENRKVPMETTQVALTRAKDGQPYDDGKVLGYDPANQVFSILADAYRPLQAGSSGGGIPPIEESGESLLQQASPSFPSGQ